MKISIHLFLEQQVGHNYDADVEKSHKLCGSIHEMNGDNEKNCTIEQYTLERQVIFRYPFSITVNYFNITRPGFPEALPNPT